MSASASAAAANRSPTGVEPRASLVAISTVGTCSGPLYWLPDTNRIATSGLSHRSGTVVDVMWNWPQLATMKRQLRWHIQACWSRSRGTACTDMAGDSCDPTQHIAPSRQSRKSMLHKAMLRFARVSIVDSRGWPRVAYLPT